jgi:hypothetical protein
MDFSELVDALILETESTNPSIDTISSIIQKAALFSQERGKRKRSDWFSDNETDLFDAINCRNEAYNKSTEDPSNSTLKQELHERRKVLRNLIKSSKDKWLNDKAHRVANKLQLNAKGGDAWQAIKEINAGTSGHQSKSCTMLMRKDCGNLTMSDSENADHMRGYYHEHFNSTEAPVQISDATRRLRRRTKRLHLGATPTPQAVIKVIVSLPSKKLPGESQIIAEALKALSPEALATIADAIIAYWENKIDAQQVHEAILIAIPKKGDLSQPKNWRPICLNDIFQKIISTLVTKNLTALYVDISRENGTNEEDIQTPLDLAFTDLPASEFQNGSLKGRGCQDGNYSLRSITQQRRNHNLGTWALFVDLCKAFDTADHDLLYKLLDIYGTPDNIINLVKRLHDDFALKLKIGNKTRDIPYGKGVKQGDVMAPILFLFLMLAFSETLEQEYEQEWDIKPIEFKYHANIRDGQLKSQPLNVRALTIKLIQLLYVDDTFFPFTTREDLVKGSNLIFDLFKRFGLLMHIGRGDVDSKTKAMYFPPSLPQKKPNNTNTTTVETATQTITDDRSSSATTPVPSTTTSTATPSNFDPNYILPAPFNVADGFISFSDSFLYLGSIITPDLRDDMDVKSRIKKATAQVGALRSFFRHPHIDLETKMAVYTATALNTVLWGCESWTLTDSIKRSLQVFHHRSLRTILNINMFEVEEQRITNAEI